MQVLAVPVKALHRGKRRLSGILSPAERSRLVMAMFEGVLGAATAQAGWTVWVVSPSEAVLAAAERRGARPVVDAAGSLGGALRAIEAELEPAGAALAVLLADLPLVTEASLRRALREATGPVAAVPAHSDRGTNLLVRRPATVIPSRFGRSSYQRHRSEASRAGVGFTAVTSTEIAFDVDTPEDVARWMSAGGAGVAFDEAVALGLPERVAVAATR